MGDPHSSRLRRATFPRRRGKAGKAWGLAKRVGMCYNAIMDDRLHNAKHTKRAQELRKYMTKEERHLWYDFLKRLPMTVYRQKPLGPYIVDFYIAEANLVIELDGSQHYEDEGERYDRERDAYLRSIGLEVLRYSNYDIHKHFKNICDDILVHLGLE